MEESVEPETALTWPANIFCRYCVAIAIGIVFLEKHPKRVLSEWESQESLFVSLGSNVFSVYIICEALDSNKGNLFLPATSNKMKWVTKL